RVAIQALPAVAGGAQSLHTNAFDEALALPTERSARIALRTQQILANEAGATDTADPLGGSYFIESLTDELEARAWELIARIDELGGAVAAIEQGFVQGEIEQAAFRHQQEVESGERVIVGVNRFAEAEGVVEARPRGHWQLAWRRFRRDHVAVASAAFVFFLLLVCFAGGPILTRVLGHGPNDLFPYATTSLRPVGPLTRVPDINIITTGGHQL